MMIPLPLTPRVGRRRSDSPGRLEPRPFRTSRRSRTKGDRWRSVRAPLKLPERDARHLSTACPWLANVPYIGPSCDLERVADVVSRHYRGEFCWSSSFDGDFVARLMAHGFLTMAQKVGKDGYALLPKMHRHRCALDFRDTHVARSTRRKAAKFELSVDRAFEEVIEGIQQQHGGECWFYPPLVEAFRMLHAQGSTHVKMRTFEVWDKATGSLVAGELGYACGDVYTSLSGFSRMASAGAVQCAATAKLLARSGYVLWDLGMELPYKTKLGAQLLPRDAFLKRLRQARAVGALRLYPCAPRECCRLLIDCPRVPVVSPPATDDSASATSETTASTDTV